MHLTTGKTGYQVIVSEVGKRGGLKKIAQLTQTFQNEAVAFAYQGQMEEQYGHIHQIEFRDLAYFPKA